MTVVMSSLSEIRVRLTLVGKRVPEVQIPPGIYTLVVNEVSIPDVAVYVSRPQSNLSAPPLSLEWPAKALALFSELFPESASSREIAIDFLRADSSVQPEEYRDLESLPFEILKAFRLY
jgi:hypothetical protein